ncbi:MAG: hypothetical protein IJN63_04240 [Clostridia bacterium]|nr:hypothetical protein [Clostridia bacterium]
MTQNTLSAKGRPHNRRSFFLRELMYGRIQFLLWMVAFFMVLPVVSIYEMTSFTVVVKRDGLDMLRSIANPMYASMYVMIAAGFIAGIAAFSVFHNKKSAYFYLGLPVKRDFLFVTRTVTGAIPAVGAYLVNVIISVLIYAANPHFGFLEIIPAFAKLTLQALLLFVWTYAITVFAASITSRGGATILLTVWLFTFLPIYQFCIMLISNLSAPNAYLPHLETEVLITRFNPLVRAVILQGELGDYYSRPYPALKVRDINFYASFSLLEVVLILAVSALAIAAAMLILRKRPAENSGESAVFFKVGEAIKLSALVPAGVLFSAFFNELFGIIGFFFGIIWGVFVIFLLLNLLLYRSGKKLFVGIKAAAILTAALVVAIILCLICGHHIENRKYTVENTKTIIVRVDPFDDIKLDVDKCGPLLEHIDKVRQSYDIGDASFGGVMAVPEEDVLIVDYRYIYSKHYSFTLIPKFGIGIRDSYRFDDETVNILFDAIRASSGDGVDLLASLFPAEEEMFNKQESSFSISYDMTPLFPSDFHLHPEKFKSPDRDTVAKLAERRVKEFMDGEYSGFAIGTVNYYTADGDWVTLPVYLGDGDIFGTKFCTPEEFLDTVTSVEIRSIISYANEKALVEKYGDIVYKYMGTEAVVGTITDKEQIKTCFEASNGSYDGYGVFNGRTSEYITFVFYGEHDNVPYIVKTFPTREKCPQFVYDMIEHYSSGWFESLTKDITKE